MYDDVTINLRTLGDGIKDFCLYIYVYIFWGFHTQESSGITNTKKDIKCYFKGWFNYIIGLLIIIKS